MKKPAIQVSEHALVRYCERVLGIDMDALRDEIARRVDRAAGLGASAVVLDGHRFVIEGATVVTVEPASSDRHPTPGRRPKRGQMPEDER